jgi:hypothetical protein
MEMNFSEYKDTIDNIIVLGDHLNDVDSIKKLNASNEIKIGFLNSNKIINCPEDFSLYEAFSHHFDIGIMNDGTLNFLNHILYDIFEHTIKTDDIYGNIEKI